MEARNTPFSARPSSSRTWSVTERYCWTSLRLLPASFPDCEPKNLYAVQSRMVLPAAAMSLARRLPNVWVANMTPALYLRTRRTMSATMLATFG